MRLRQAGLKALCSFRSIGWKRYPAFAMKKVSMGAAGLEDLLRVHPLRTSENLWDRTVADAISRLALLVEGYALMGTIAMGVHARPRFTEKIEAVLSCNPPNVWIEALRDAGYNECKYGVWTRHGLVLSISVRSSAGSLSAIQHAKLHPLFGREIRLAEPKDLLWIYLERGDLPESILDAFEIISSCPLVVEELRAELSTGQIDFVSRLDQWAERVRLARLSNYSDSVIARRLEQSVRLGNEQ